MPGGGWLNGPIESRSGVKSSTHFAPCSAAAARPAMIPVAARPQPRRIDVVRQRSRACFGRYDVAMELPVVPTQLAAGQRAARYRFASEKDPHHALMMLAATDTSARLPSWSWSAPRASQPLTAISTSNSRQRPTASWAARSPCSRSAARWADRSAPGTARRSWSPPTPHNSSPRSAPAFGAPAFWPGR